MLWNSVLRASVATGDKRLFATTVLKKAHIVAAPLFAFAVGSLSVNKLIEPETVLTNFVEMTPFEKWGMSTLCCVDQDENIIKINSLQPIKYESVSESDNMLTIYPILIIYTYTAVGFNGRSCIAATEGRLEQGDQLDRQAHV